MSTFAPIKLLDGNEIPGLAFGLGTAHFGKSGADGVDRDLVETVKTALAVNYKHIDCAEAYGNEASVGVALAESGIDRSELYLTTKVAAGLKDNSYRATLEGQLKKLQTSYVDLYLIHWPYDLGKNGFPTILEAWKQLEELRDEGLVKSIGVSNFRKAELAQIVDSKPKHLPVANQIEFHPYVYSTEGTSSVVEYAQANGIVIEAYGPTQPVTTFAGGPLDPVLDEVTKAVSSRAGKEVQSSQVLLKLASQEGAVVVTTSGKEWRMKEQLAAGAIPELTAEEVSKIKAAAKEKTQRKFMKHMDEKV